MKALFGGALALGTAMAIWSGPAQAAQITIDLTASPAQVGFDPAVLNIGLTPGFTESLGYNAGSLRARATINGDTLFPYIFRGDVGMGVCSASFLVCLENPEIDGFDTNESVTFSITNQEAGFEFVLVGATFGGVQNVGVDAFDNARLRFDGTNHDFDIATVANSQNPGSCFGLFASCYIDFLEYIGNGDLDAMSADSFRFTARGDADGWYLQSVVWELRAVPEPATIGVLGLALAGLGAARRRRA